MRKLNNFSELFKCFCRYLNTSKCFTAIAMPKQVVQKDTLRHIKYKTRLGGKLPVADVIDLVVVGNGAPGCPHSVMVTTSMNRYLFNCGEGTQRLATEHKLKIARLGNVFITHKSWQNIGGLPGMALTLQASNVPDLSLHGPPNVETVITKAKNFSMLTTLNVAKADESEFEDNTMKVQTVPVHKSDGDDKQEDMAYFYVCTPQQLQGKLDIGKAVDLGLPRGPVLGILKDGLEVTLDDGRVIKPEQVLSDVDPVRPFVVLECPSHDHIPSLVTNDELLKFQRSSNPAIDVIVHMSPDHVMSDDRYQQWMNGFGCETNHLIVNESNRSVCHKAPYRIQAKLNQLHDSIFPLLPNQIAMDKLNCHEDSNTSNILRAHASMRYRIRPRKSPDYSQCVVLDNDSFVSECAEVEGFTDSLQQLKNTLKTADTACGSAKPEVVFLGTGSSQPSKERNVSSIVLNISDDSTLLLDCGEGTCGQLYRFYGGQKFEDALHRLSAVFVSHMHADHHLGLFAIMEARRKVFFKRGQEPSKLAVIGPFQLKYWFDSVDKDLIPINQLIEFFSIQHVVSNQLDDEKRLIFQDYLKRLHLTELLPVEVRHCKHAYGVVVSHQDGWKIVYSGDTMPCDALVAAGQNCDLLIHEATMEDDMAEEALVKTHSTTSQAIDIGMRMKAGFILLNHFSQRYAKIPLINANFCDKVGISFDNMRVNLQQLSLLPHFFPTLKSMFQEHYAEMEEKLNRRNIKRKLDQQDGTVTSSKK